MRVSQTLLHKLEDLLHTAGYRVRYEKGTFRGGSCVLQDQRIIVVNKFFPLEGRVNTLMEVVAALPLQAATLNPEQNRLVEQVRAAQVKRAAAPGAPASSSGESA